MSGMRRKDGPLGPQVEGYRDWLTQRGYTPGTVRNMLKDVGRLGRWLSIEGLPAEQLDEEVAGQFLAASLQPGYRQALGMRGMRPLLGYLREAGVIPVGRPSSTPVDMLVGRYRLWLVQERGLASATVLRYENTARRFLREQACAHGTFDPAALTGVDVNAFLLRECARVSTGSAKGRVCELRSLLRFLYLQDITVAQLAAAVPPVGGWRLAGLPPRTVTMSEVQLLLDSCPRDTIVGVRDYAIMLLVARLGLRSIEVARLELGDVHWRTGELLVRGKGRRQDLLPLPAEVGEALAAYLSRGRIPNGARHVFVTCRAPRRPIRAEMVGYIVKAACRRAGVPQVGPHRLRHALAGELLRQGAGLAAISHVLRHQDLATTALYAKVDLDMLREVAQPWPGASR